MQLIYIPDEGEASTFNPLTPQSSRKTFYKNNRETLSRFGNFRYQKKNHTLKKELLVSQQLYL